MRLFGGWAFCLEVWMCGIASVAGAAEYYVAPTGGSDTNTGSLGSPFATFGKAIGLAGAGDTIYARGGTYNLSTSLTISASKDGTAANPYQLFAYPGESPILDFRSQPYSSNNSGLKGLDLQADYWHVKGLTVQYAADNGVFVSGSNNLVEQVVSRQNQDSGIQISAAGSGADRRHPANNVLLNCDSYGNFDYGGLGENADGFAIKFRDLGPGNTVIGARSWENGDDGFDFWQAEYGVTVLNSWSFHNGIASAFNNPAGYQGDSNGLKLGKDSGTHLLENILTWGNDANGVDVNGNATESGGTVVPAVIPHGVQAFNITSAFNGGSNFRFDENPTTTSPPSAHILRNNISYSGGMTLFAGNTADHNTFAGPGGTPAGIGVTQNDFVSTTDPVLIGGNYRPAGTGGDRSGVTIPVHATGPAVGPRLADGSLPLIDFLRLAAGSHLIDAGVYVGLPYNGLAPDLGWQEFVPPGPALPGDYNGDNTVNAADYTLWRNSLGTNTSLANDETPGSVDESDYEVWKSHFGMSLAESGGQSAGAVPEPAGLAMLLVAVLAAILARRN